MPRFASRAGHAARLDSGVTMIEYALLVALVLVVAAGALVYFSRSAAGPGRLVDSAAVGVACGHASSPGPPPTTWCSTVKVRCSDTIGAGSQQVIDCWANGGSPPYSYSLSGNPDFVQLPDLDTTNGKGQLLVQPTRCSDASTYGPIVLLVSDSSAPHRPAQLLAARHQGP